MTFNEWWKDQWQFFEAATHIDKREVALAAWEAAQPKWLPVSEAPEFTDVLVKEITGHIYIAERQGSKWWQSIENEDIRVRPVKWMPLPEEQ